MGHCYYSIEVAPLSLRCQCEALSNPNSLTTNLISSGIVVSLCGEPSLSTAQTVSLSHATLPPPIPDGTFHQQVWLGPCS